MKKMLIKVSNYDAFQDEVDKAISIAKNHINKFTAKSYNIHPFPSKNGGIKVFFEGTTKKNSFCIWIQDTTYKAYDADQYPIRNGNVVLDSFRVEELSNVTII